jgi:hypothetical protein
VLSVVGTDVNEKVGGSTRSWAALSDDDERDVIEEALEAFVPFPALNAIYAGALDTIAELRQVTTMFLKLDSYSPVTHQDPLSLQVRGAVDSFDSFY